MRQHTQTIDMFCREFEFFFFFFLGHKYFVWMFASQRLLKNEALVGRIDF